MNKIICASCERVHESIEGESCPKCGTGKKEHSYNFRNSDDHLRSQVPIVIEERKQLGLEGLVGGLEAVIINVEPDNHDLAIEELLRYTGFQYQYSFEDAEQLTSVLGGVRDSSDILIRTRKADDNPFRKFNLNPRSSHLPNTRLETYIFSTTDIESYAAIQKKRGIRFIGNISNHENYSFIQTYPSDLTGISIGLIQWHGERNFRTGESKAVNKDFGKPDFPHLENIGRLDHTAARVRSRDRDAAIIEFMRLTNYDFDMAIYVRSMNSITNVARLSDGEFAMVFTSGITPFRDAEASGPTEKFIHNYGTRPHHMAFETRDIENTFQGLKDSGMKFLLGLIGSEGEGLKQTFSEALPGTLIVNEYIHRYGDFDGFFSKGNVTKLTEATQLQ